MRKVVIIIALLVVPGLLLAADPPPVSFESTMNLAEHISDSISVPANVTLTIHIINMAPANVINHVYDTYYEQYTVDPAPIKTEGTFKQESPPGVDQAAAEAVKGDQRTKETLALDAVRTPDQKALALSALLAVEVDESKIPADVVNLQDALAEPAVTATVKAIGETLIKSTKLDLILKDITLGADQGLILTINRGPVGRRKKETWRRDFHVGGPGKFISNYVFGFAPRGDEQFFSKASNPAATYTITRTVRRDKVSYVPLVLFSWIPASKGNQTGVNSWAAGLGYDLSNLVVAGSYLWTWHRNLGITAGVMAQKQQRLKGTYHEGDVVTTNLQSTDLTEAVWRPNVFVGISIRSVSALFH